MMEAVYKRYILNFKQASGTSRGILRQKETWFIVLSQDERYGIGECGLLRGLSIDDRADYEEKLDWVCANIHLGKEELYRKLWAFPSIQMGLEMAFLSLYSEEVFRLFDNSFSRGDDFIPINGLIWMGQPDFMLDQIKEKIGQGFRCVKMKIGAIAFDKELEVLRFIRQHYSEDEITIRVDANGAFGSDALEKLKTLNQLKIHSIEQPLPKGNIEAMKELCLESPLPIALDEELIGLYRREEKIELLEKIDPSYIILKPSFIGGFTGAEEWASLAKERGIDSWVTSALESNIGLNAIAQWTYQKGFSGYQGLGTGSLFDNNFPSPLEIKKDYLTLNKQHTWTVSKETFL
ncbi:MAG: o-succinylbenzoate synthase [Flavobacteriaceae bacterium]